LKKCVKVWGGCLSAASLLLLLDEFECDEAIVLSNSGAKSNGWNRIVGFVGPEIFLGPNEIDILCEFVGVFFYG